MWTNVRHIFFWIWLSRWQNVVEKLLTIIFWHKLLQKIACSVLNIGHGFFKRFVVFIFTRFANILLKMRSQGTNLWYNEALYQKFENVGTSNCSNDKSFFRSDSSLHFNSKVYNIRLYSKSSSSNWSYIIR